MIFVLDSEFLLLEIWISHAEFHVQKKLTKNNNMNLLAVSFALIGEKIKADELFMQNFLDKRYSEYIAGIHRHIIERKQQTSPIKLCTTNCNFNRF